MNVPPRQAWARHACVCVSNPSSLPQFMPHLMYTKHSCACICIHWLPRQSCVIYKQKPVPKTSGFFFCCFLVHYRLVCKRHIGLDTLTSSMSTWKTLSSLLYNLLIPCAMEVIGHLSIGKATIEKVRSGSECSREDTLCVNTELLQEAAILPAN